MKSLVLLALLSVCFSAAFALQGKNVCCTNQPALVWRVEKIRTDTRYKVTTYSERYSTKCGTFGWRRCTRHRQRTRSTAYKVDIYQRKSSKPSCAKYDCCHGFTAIDNQCYANSELKPAVGHIGDIKDALKDLGDIDVNDIIDTVHGGLVG